MSKPRFTSIALLVAAFGLPAASVIAAPVDDAPPTQTVSYADLNLASPEGAATLKARLASAAKSVCGDPDVRDLRAMSRSSACRQTAMANANTQMDVAMAQATQNQRFAMASTSSNRSSAR